jgi:hypothetical protein
MTSAGIVQKLWNYCNVPGLGQSLARSPGREYALLSGLAVAFPGDTILPSIAPSPDILSGRSLRCVCPLDKRS